MHLAGISFALFFGLVCAADTDSPGRPSFSGKWEINPDKSQLQSGKPSPRTLVIQQNGSSIHVVRTMSAGGKEPTVEFTCTTDGKDCEVRGGKVSLWYNGGSLVEMEIADGVVTTTTMKMQDDGTLNATLSYIPEAKPDTLVFEKK